MSTTVGNKVVIRFPRSVTVSGRLDEIPRVTGLLVREGYRDMTLDLSKCKTIDSSGIGLLVSIFTFLTQHGGSLTLSRPSRSLVDILTITQLITVFSITDADCSGPGTHEIDLSEIRIQKAKVESSTERGARFEERVYEIIVRELNDKRLGLLPSACSVHLRKGYYSRDRGKNIIVDVAIEMKLPEAKTWSLLWAWECKDYTGAVPVSDLEEFWAKLQQIGGTNVKGGFITSGYLQSGALKFAEAKGLTVMRLLPENEVVVLLSSIGFLPFVRIDTQMGVRALTEPSFRPEQSPAYSLHKGEAFRGWHTLLLAGLFESSRNFLVHLYGRDYESWETSVAENTLHLDGESLLRPKFFRAGDRLFAALNNSLIAMGLITGPPVPDIYPTDFAGKPRERKITHVFRFWRRKRRTWKFPVLWFDVVPQNHGKPLQVTTTGSVLEIKDQSFVREAEAWLYYYSLDIDPDEFFFGSL